jgi:prepilin peptidase CpaA
MISTATLLVLLSIATVTDIRWRKIFNWNTYSGIVIAVCYSIAAISIRPDVSDRTMTWAWTRDIVPIQECLVGFAACGFAMLVCYVFFAGAIGGGDVKLVAMMGAFLGLELGLEAMLWTFVVGGCQALITVFWKYGVWNVARRSLSSMWNALRWRRPAELSFAERQTMKTDLFLSPSALAAVLIVRVLPIERLSM